MGIWNQKKKKKEVRIKGATSVKKWSETTLLMLILDNKYTGMNKAETGKLHTLDIIIKCVQWYIFFW